MPDTLTHQLARFVCDEADALAAQPALDRQGATRPWLEHIMAPPPPSSPTTPSRRSGPAHGEKT